MLGGDAALIGQPRALTIQGDLSKLPFLHSHPIHVHYTVYYTAHVHSSSIIHLLGVIHVYSDDAANIHVYNALNRAAALPLQAISSQASNRTSVEVRQALPSARRPALTRAARCPRASSHHLTRHRTRLIATGVPGHRHSELDNTREPVRASTASSSLDQHDQHDRTAGVCR